MTIKELIQIGLKRSRLITNMLTADLSDDDLKVRYLPNANTLAWQLGHLIVAENGLIESIRKGAMPALPAGFAEAHAKNAAGDESLRPWTKAEYLKLYDQQREATLKLLADATEEEMAKPMTGQIAQICPNGADAFQFVGEHESMHSGQITALRRKLDKPHVF